VEHLEHFRLSQEPFANDPVLDFYLPTRQHAEAEKRVLRSVRQSKGLCVLLGEGGSGKTMLARHLLEELDEEKFEASLIVMVQRGVDTAWVLSRIAGQLGVEDPSDDPASLLGDVYRRLVEIHEEGRQALVIIDEAQMLGSAEAVEALRGLLNLEHEERHLLSLVLIGPQDLAQVLALDAAFLERIDVSVRLAPLDAENSASYLAHRIRCAGGDPGILEPEAISALHELGHGVPRRMNTLADNALYEAYLAGRDRVEKDDVLHAARDLEVGDASTDAAHAPDPAAAPPKPANPSGGAAAANGPPNAADGSRTALLSSESPLGVTQVMMDLDDEEDVGADSVAVTAAEPEPPRGAPAETQLLDTPPEEGELDDLFAELIDDE
jgi:type II secretory pathway predicted ATPase ExeA